MFSIFILGLKSFFWINIPKEKKKNVIAATVRAIFLGINWIIIYKTVIFLSFFFIIK